MNINLIFLNQNIQKKYKFDFYKLNFCPLVVFLGSRFLTWLVVFYYISKLFEKLEFEDIKLDLFRATETRHNLTIAN